MAESLLARISRTPADTARLPEGERLALVHTLLEWGAVDDALACLAWTPDDAGDDWRVPAAEALRRSGRFAEAMTMAQSLRTEGFPRHALLARILLESGDSATALALAESLASAEAGRAEAWTLLGDVHLARGSISDAEIDYTQACRLDVHDPAPCVGLVRAAHAAGSGAAEARALLDDRGPAALNNDELNALASVLRGDETGDVTHLRMVHAELVNRYDRALLRLRQPFERLQEPPGAPPARLTQSGEPSEARAPGTPASAREVDELQIAVRKYFGYPRLQPAQADVIAATRRGEDLLAILPTGGGKSLCYQLPAFLDGGITLVVSPLVALMKDQVEQLPARLRPSAVALHAGADPAQLRTALEGAAAGRYRLIYTAPERLRQRDFVAALRQTGLTRMVIDEAHCVAVWGHDFRPDYLHLPRAHADLGSPPLLALTATAPPELRREIEVQLFQRDGMKERPHRVIATDPARPNLWLGVRLVKSNAERSERLIQMCATLPGAGIVYMRSRAQTEELATALRAAGIKAAAYHAGLQNRAEVQDRFMRGEIRVVVATIAFGMGINKPDIRFVLHGGLPGSLEAYMQEVGRAGRDGSPAICLLFCTERDIQSNSREQGQDEALAIMDRLMQAINQSVGKKRSGLLQLDELVATLGVDDTTVRVALSLLEQAGIVERDYDVPRTLQIYLRKPGRSLEFQRFAQAAGLAHGQPAQWTFAALAEATHLAQSSAAGAAPAQLAEKLLAWQEAGHIAFYPAGRSILLTLRARPRDAAERLQQLTRARAAAQSRRAAQVAHFVRSRQAQSQAASACRQVELAALLGNPARVPCGFCDACGVAPADVLAIPAGGWKR